MGYPFYQVDVFAETKYSGNQLAVISKAGGLSGTLMQNIAREMNFSETTFIISDRENNGGYDVRIFSLDEELPFAGHPTLGTAYIIQQEIIGREVPEVRLNLRAGQIPVRFTYSGGMPDVLWMKQLAPVFGREFDAGAAAAALAIDTAAVDRRFPVLEVSTGLPFIIVPLKSLDAVKACRINRESYLELIKGADAKSVFVFCPETYLGGNDINARMFDDYHGIAEDPATGSANGCLAAYLVRNRYYNRAAIDLRVEQGFEIGRPSLLLIQAAEDKAGNISVSVGGTVIPVARGELI